MYVCRVTVGRTPRPARLVVVNVSGGSPSFARCDLGSRLWVKPPVSGFPQTPWMSGCPSGVRGGHESALGSGLSALAGVRLWAFDFELWARGTADTPSAITSTANPRTRMVMTRARYLGAPIRD